MKKMYKLGWFFIVLIVFTACKSQSYRLEDTLQRKEEEIVREAQPHVDSQNNNNSQKQKDSVEQTESEEQIVLENLFDEDDIKLMIKSDANSNGAMYDCIWRESNVNFTNGIMELSIYLDGEDHHPKYSSGEYCTRQFYQYGFYEVSMKPIQHNGVVSSFFIYTGPSDGNVKDGISISFLGKDTTKVRCDYLSDGIGNHEFFYDLGFDASTEFHEYGFEWTKDCITWYVDQKAVHTVETAVPKTPARIMMNVWPGIGVDDWLGSYDGETPLTAQYDWFRYTEYKEE